LRLSDKKTNAIGLSGKPIKKGYGLVITKQFHNCTVNAESDSEIEWVCPECNDKGTYQEIRTPLDKGVDSCPECGTEVKAI